MITVEASSRFEARVEGFPSGLEGTVGVRILDNTGGTWLARTTSGVLEDPAGSGSYTATLPAPAVEGQYSVFWDWDGGGTLVPSHTAAEDLRVVAATVQTPAPPPIPPGLPGLAAQVPHLALPFRFADTGAVVVDQDSDEEIFYCCEAILRCPQGHRIERPDFGLPDQTFRQGGADPAAVQAALDRWEPRARTAATADNALLGEALTLVDTLIEPNTQT